MNFKIFFAIFGTLLVIQGSHQSPAVKIDYKDIIVSALQNVLNHADKALDKVSDMVADAEANQDKYEQQIIHHIVDLAQKLNDKIYEVLEHIKGNINESARKIVGCIENEREKISGVFNKSATDLGSCLAPENNLVLDGVKDVVTQFKGVVSDLKVKTDALAACTDDDMTCILGFGNSALEVAKKVEELAVEDFQKLKELIQTLEKNASGCLEEVASNAKDNLQEIVEETVSCVIG